MNINLHIERLVLDGVDVEHDQCHLLQASITNELTQLLMAGGLPPGLAEGVVLPHVSAINTQSSDNDPTGFGRQIAQSVYGGLDNE